jgi:hypothetical protein
MELFYHNPRPLRRKTLEILWGGSYNKKDNRGARRDGLRVG